MLCGFFESAYHPSLQLAWITKYLLTTLLLPHSCYRHFSWEALSIFQFSSIISVNVEKYVSSSSLSLHTIFSIFFCSFFLSGFYNIFFSYRHYLYFPCAMKMVIIVSWSPLSYRVAWVPGLELNLLIWTNFLIFLNSQLYARL